MIYVCEHHDEVLALWREQDLSDIRLCHVDFHDDLRGLLIDRRRGVAHAVGALARGAAALDPGNFLAHAVLEGRIRGLRWVHDIPGGRAWDAGIVRYESDLLALPQRIRHRLGRGREVPLEFEEILIDNWRGPASGERLSVDWDCFASILHSKDSIRSRVAIFLERLVGHMPADTYLAYSPEYCRPTFPEFRSLVDELAARFAQPVRWLSPGLERGELHPTDVDAGLPTGNLMRLILWLRRRGVY